MRVKEYREKELKNFTSFITLLFFTLCLPFPTEIFDGKTENMIAVLEFIHNVVIALLAPLFITFFDAIFPYKWKQVLSGPLYGSKIFTEIEKGKVNDMRIDNDKAMFAYDKIINRLDAECNRKKRRKYENTKWYNIYKKYDGYDAVNQTQADYLLCLDMVCISILSLISYAFLYKVFDSVLLSSRFIIAILVMGILSWLGMRNKMKRFVYTVIATDLANQERFKQLN